MGKSSARVTAPELIPMERMSFEEMQEGKSAVQQKGGTRQDEREMARMGKSQELRRNFKFVGIIGFVTILQSTWEGALLVNYYGLLNGGTAGVIWCTIAVWLCMLAMIASLAEMASMAPTAGGQYHWVSEFAPKSFQKSRSYVVAGESTARDDSAGKSGLGSGATVAGDVDRLPVHLFDHQFQHLLRPSSAAGRGHDLICARLRVFAFLLVLWIMAEHVPAQDVFITFNNGGGWSSQGLSCLVGLTTPIWCFIGPDAGGHMSEELKDASLQLPRAMVWATFANGVMGITMLISFCFCITDLNGIFDTTNPTTVIGVIFNATQSQSGTLVLGSVLVILLFFSAVTTIASSSRQIWAFSRDGGLPFSSWVRRVRPGWDIPVNALLLCLIISIAFSAINFGSATALNAILSISNAALIFSYIISIGCIRLKRFRNEPLLPRRWSLGGWGWLINDITLAFLLVAFIFSFFPEYPSLGDDNWAANFNWAIILFTGTAVLALVYYVLGGGRRYVAPVSLMKEE